jgi:hypothetical protein
MEAFILGAVPPYSMLLCGKLVAMLCANDEVREVFRKKYGKGQSLINREEADGRLSMIATTSALGRSSIYNRVRFGDRLLMFSVGFTSGWGEFQFTNGAYAQLRDYAENYCQKTAKHEAWGKRLPAAEVPPPTPIVVPEAADDAESSLSTEEGAASAQTAAGDGAPTAPAVAVPETPPAAEE